MGEGNRLSEAEILERILYGSPEQQKVEEAIQKALNAFVETATEEIKKLVQNNFQGPDVKAEMEVLQKAVIDMTIKAIKDGPLGATYDGGQKQGQ